MKKIFITLENLKSFFGYMDNEKKKKYFPIALTNVYVTIPIGTDDAESLRG